MEDLAALIDEEGGEATLFGVSSGAVLGLQAAVSGLRISKLAIYEPPFRLDESAPPVPTTSS